MSAKAAILVSACLLGECCRYDGSSKRSEPVIALAQYFELVPACPEVLGGLATPRLPSERLGARVIRSDGVDLSAAFASGAQETLRIAREYAVIAAILKSKSPSCGFGKIYDGSFRGVLIDGNGVAADALFRAGVPVYHEFDDFSGLIARGAADPESKGG